MRRRRCLIPADGFYEWTGPKGKRRPFHISPRQPRLIAFAGLYECWQDPSGGEIDTVTILTCQANPTVAEVHDRLHALHWARWCVFGDKPCLEVIVEGAVGFWDERGE